MKKQKWINEYEELMFGSDYTIETMARAAELKQKNMPERIYKYRQSTKEHIRALEQGVLFFSPPSSLNDVFESTVQTETSIKEMIMLQTATMLKVYGIDDVHDVVKFKDVPKESDVTIDYGPLFCIDTICNVIAEEIGYKRNSGKTDEELMLAGLLAVYDEYQKRTRKRYSICSFSERNDISPMWALYAENHTGFCIEYNFKQLGEDNLFNSLLLPVIYKDMPVVTVNSSNWMNLGSACMHAFSLKSSEWSYEQEWRCFSQYSLKPKGVTMPTPSAVFVGYNIKQFDFDWIQDICNSKQIPIYKMNIVRESYKLLPERIS